MKFIDALLDRITMYRLTLYYLIVLVAIAIGLCVFGYLSFNPFALAFSAGYITIICWLSNKIFAYVFEAPVNVESVYITALILTLIVNPLKIPHDLFFLTAIAGLAIASKFVIAIHKKHIFNPAAVAVALTAFGAGQSAGWWVGNIYMMPFVLIGGLLIIRKIHHGQMVITFFAAVASSTIITSLLSHHNIWANLQKTTLHSSLFFLAFVMLTEPLTSPSTKSKQAWYAGLIGLLFPPQIHFMSLYSTPELSLLVGNIFAYVVNPKVNMRPILLEKLTIAPDIVDFVFQPERPFSYKPGQYMELTLPHENSDIRGVRRYFTLASSPTEKNIRLGVKFYPQGSSFKSAMFAMDKTSLVAAGQLGGDFVLPSDRSQKLAFIAGGIGVTPYRSMMKYLLDTNDQRTVTMLYSEKNTKELVYTDVFAEAQRKLGAKIVYTLTDKATIPAGWSGEVGYISVEMIKANMPDYKERLFYISGSQTMVESVQNTLHNLGVSRQRIKTDFFPGYA